MQSKLLDIADEELKTVNGGNSPFWDIVSIFAPGIGQLGEKLTETTPAGDFSPADMTALGNGTAWGGAGDSGSDDQGAHDGAAGNGGETPAEVHRAL